MLLKINNSIKAYNLKKNCVSIQKISTIFNGKLITLGMRSRACCLYTRGTTTTDGRYTIFYTALPAVRRTFAHDEPCDVTNSCWLRNRDNLKAHMKNNSSYIQVQVFTILLRVYTGDAWYIPVRLNQVDYIYILYNIQNHFPRHVPTFNSQKRCQLHRLSGVKGVSKQKTNVYRVINSNYMYLQVQVGTSNL